MSMELQEKIDVMVAFRDGAELEAKAHNYGEWLTHNTYKFNFTHYYYRVKPSTKDMTVAEISNKLGYDVRVVK